MSGRYDGLIAQPLAPQDAKLPDVVGWYGNDTATWSYGYSPDGLRTTKAGPGSDVSYTWDRSGALPMLLATNTAGSGATYYIYGPGGLAYEQINPDGSVYYLHHDQLGSTRLITDSSGAVVGSASYDAYGNPSATTGDVTTDLGYAGQYVDAETGYQYLRARFYDPATGQFLTRDPANAMTRSAYGYVYGNPLNGTDPSGLWAWDGVCIRGVNCPIETQSLGESWGQCFREDHPDVAQGIVDFLSGVLAVNPITMATNATGLTDTDQKANTGSGWYKAGVVSMLFVDFAAGPSIGQGRGVVTHWGEESPWVMNGGKSGWNFIKSGMPGRAAYSTGETMSAEGLSLSWPSGVEWWKGFLGQRIVG